MQHCSHCGRIGTKKAGSVLRPVGSASVYKTSHHVSPKALPSSGLALGSVVSIAPRLPNLKEHRFAAYRQTAYLTKLLAVANHIRTLTMRTLTFFNPL